MRLSAKIKEAGATGYILLWLLDSPYLSQEQKEFGRMLDRIEKPIHVVLNKMDLQKDRSLTPKLKTELGTVLTKPFRFYPVSALTKSGINDLVGGLISALPLSPPHQRAFRRARTRPVTIIHRIAHLLHRAFDTLRDKTGRKGMTAEKRCGRHRRPQRPLRAARACPPKRIV